MGNYKEGFLEIPLQKDTPLSVIEPFVILEHFFGDKDLKNDRTSRESRIERYIQSIKKSSGNNEKLLTMLSSAAIGRLYIDIHFNIFLPWCNEMFEIDELGYVAYCDFMSRPFDKTMENFNKLYEFYSNKDLTFRKLNNNVKLKTFYNVILYIKVCSKQYSDEFDKIINFLRPYIDSDDILGKIQDEDGYLNKKFFKDSREDVDLAVMSFCCPGCKSYNPGVNCDDFYSCKIAFKNGINLALRNKDKAQSILFTLADNKYRQSSS